MKLRKALKRLRARQQDYDRMVAGTKQYNGYKRPGSMTK